MAKSLSHDVTTFDGKLFLLKLAMRPVGDQSATCRSVNEDFRAKVLMKRVDLSATHQHHLNYDSCNLSAIVICLVTERSQRCRKLCGTGALVFADYRLK